MFRKLHAVALVLVLAAGLFGFNHTTQPTARAASAAESLLSLLPASDVIAYGDTRQAISVVLPALYAQQPELKAKMDRAFADFQRETGIDPNNFDSIAVGARFDRQGSRSDLSFVAIARGSFDAATAIDTSMSVHARKVNSNRVKTTVEYGGQQIYVSGRADADGKTPAYNDRDLAAIVIDTNTIAVGDLSSMRAVVDAAAGKNRVDDELVALATRTPGALGGFAGNMSGVISEFVVGGHGSNNEFGKTLSGVKQIYGSVTSAGNDLDLRVAVRTDNADQARNIGSMINALKLFTKASDNNNNGRRSMESLVRDVNVTVEGNEVDLTLRASLTDAMQFVHHF